MAANLAVSAPTAPLINDKLAFIASRISQLDASGGLQRKAIGGIQLLRALLSPVAVAANTSVEQTFSVPGLLTGSAIVVNKPSSQAGLVLGGARVAGNALLGLTFGNLTGAPITPTASETYLVLAIS